MRLAGTCSKYSNRAMPQLTSAAVYQGTVAKLFRWPYQAKVMNTLLAISNTMVCQDRGMEDRKLMAAIILRHAKSPAACTAGLFRGKPSRLRVHGRSGLGVVLNLVEVEVLVPLVAGRGQHAHVGQDKVYQYLNFDKIEDYTES